MRLQYVFEGNIEQATILSLKVHTSATQLHLCFNLAQSIAPCVKFTDFMGLCSYIAVKIELIEHGK